MISAQLRNRNRLISPMPMKSNTPSNELKHPSEWTMTCTRNRAALILSLLLAAFAGEQSEAGIIVNQTHWGDASTTGTLAWAIAQANATSGPSTIDIQLARGTQISVKNGATLPFTSYLTEISEDLTINGNGAVLFGNPAFVSSGGIVFDKFNLSEFGAGVNDILVEEAKSFAQIKEGVSVTINDLDADGINGYVDLAEDSTVNMNDVSVSNTVPYGHGSRAVVNAKAGATANLTRITLDRINMFEEPFPGAEFAWVGAIGAQNATINVVDSVLRGTSSSAGAISAIDSTVNFVSSIVEGTMGGISSLGGSANIVNSLMRLSGDSSLARIQSLENAITTIRASTIQVDHLFLNNNTGPNGYGTTGAPLRAFDGGSINLHESAVSVRNFDYGPAPNGLAYYVGSDGLPNPNTSDGSFSADAATYISPTPTQSLQDLQTLFGQSNLLTGPVFPTLSIEDIELYLPLPQGARPMGSLIDAITDADGSNQLLNPIDGTPILWDVYGNRRTINGFRDSGAVQHVPEPGSLVIWSLAGLVAVRRRRRS